MQQKNATSQLRLIHDHTNQTKQAALTLGNGCTHKTPLYSPIPFPSPSIHTERGVAGWSECARGPTHLSSPHLYCPLLPSPHCLVLASSCPHHTALYCLLLIPKMPLLSN